ncbi:MAG: hypothetical protein JW727_03225 [Candidatus Aenigmarchaeota archaeon]|nr:hypothetical protein [Candidatus Aenigmarchaeota archaeon]
MGFKDLCVKLGSLFVKKKVRISDIDKKNITTTVDNIMNKGTLVTSETGSVNISLTRKPPEETDKLEKLAGMYVPDTERKEFLGFVIEKITSKEDVYIRNAFLDLADFEWNENSIRQNVSTWPLVMNHFLMLGQSMPSETSVAVIRGKLQIAPDEADFLAKKQIIFKKWKDELCGRARRAKERLK